MRKQVQYSIHFVPERCLITVNDLHGMAIPLVNGGVSG